MPGGITPGDRQCLLGKVNGDYARTRQGFCGRHSNAARSSPDICQQRVSLGEPLYGCVQQQLSFGAGNEYIDRYLKFQTAKPLPTQQVLKRFSLSSLCDVREESFTAGFRNLVMEMGQKIASIFPQFKGEQTL